MRFTISREKLQEGLAAVTASIPAKTTLPVLANILLETTDKGIKLSGTDLDIADSTEVMADVETAGAVTVPAKKLSEIARELPPAPVKMAAVGEQRVTLDCGRSRFKLLGLPRDEFPTFPAVKFNESWRIMKLQAGSSPAILLLPQSLLKKSSTQELPSGLNRRSH